MIYLIGGPPRCGKTTLAKILSQKLSIPWISCDTLEVISGEYMSQAEWNASHPYWLLRRKHKTNDDFYHHLPPGQIVNVLRGEARATFPAIEMMVLCEMTEGNDYIIEGYHIEPSLARMLIKKYGRKNIHAVFLVKHDAKKFVEDVHKSTTSNDWLVRGTKKQETFLKVGEMVSMYSRYIEKDVRKYGLSVLGMDKNFESQIQKAFSLK